MLGAETISRPWCCGLGDSERCGGGAVAGGDRW